MVEKSKPEPDIFLKAANLLGVSCEHCYVIEDSYNGIRGAQAAGMIPIMVPDMLEPDDEMRQKARYILKDLYEVEKIIMSNIKVLLWDIDATLLNFEKAEKAAINSCFEKFGLGECTEEMLRTYIVINRKHWEALEKGTLTKQEVLEGRFREFFGVYGLDVTKAEAFNIEYQIRLGDTVVFNDNGYELVKSLKGKVLQYAVTNGTKAAQDRKLAKSGLIDLFDGIFISDVIGYEKPSLQFFDAVFNEIGDYDRSEVLIVGDSLTSDIQGGNNAGILCCWFNPQEKPAKEGLRIDYQIQRLPQVLKICGLK
jgi:2-haloacid dehalogenase